MKGVLKILQDFSGWGGWTDESMKEDFINVGFQ